MPTRGHATHTQRHAARAQATQPTDANTDTRKEKEKDVRGGTKRRGREEVEGAAAKEGRDEQDKLDELLLVAAQRVPSNDAEASCGKGP